MGIKNTDTTEKMYIHNDVDFLKFHTSNYDQKSAGNWKWINCSKKMYKPLQKLCRKMDIFIIWTDIDEEILLYVRIPSPIKTESLLDEPDIYERMRTRKLILKH